MSLQPPTEKQSRAIWFALTGLAVATVMTVTLSTDHRCVDGALGAELLQAFKRYIESPMGMLV